MSKLNENLSNKIRALEEEIQSSTLSQTEAEMEEASDLHEIGHSTLPENCEPDTFELDHNSEKSFESQQSADSGQGQISSSQKQPEEPSVTEPDEINDMIAAIEGKGHAYNLLKD